jgi:tetrahydrodipicolinate N-acetyltransferase
VTVAMESCFITHLDVGKSNLLKIYPPRKGSIIIHDHTFIGARSTIMMDIEIGRSSFIAAGSVVIRDVAPNTQVGGVPATVIKKMEPLEPRGGKTRKNKY